jgi:hypothetical protein
MRPGGALWASEENPAAGFLPTRSIQQCDSSKVIRHNRQCGCIFKHGGGVDFDLAAARASNRRTTSATMPATELEWIRTRNCALNGNLPPRK